MLNFLGFSCLLSFSVVFPYVFIVSNISVAFKAQEEELQNRQD